MVVTLISVYEHLLPRQRLPSLKEINRVLKIRAYWQDKYQICICLLKFIASFHFNHICLNHWQNSILRNSQWFHGNTMGWIGFELASEDLKMIALKHVLSKWKSEKQNISLT